MKINVLTVAVGFAGVVVTGVAGATGPQDSWVKLGAGLFGNDEKSTYGNFEAGTRLNEHFLLRLDATASPFRTFNGSGFNVRHGGSDVEVLGTYRWTQGTPAELSLGASEPNTPERTSAVMTYRARVGAPKSNGFEMWADSYGLVGGGAISMLGLGARYDLTPSVKLEASGALPIQGDNSVDPRSGATNKQGVYSVGFTLPAGKSSFSLALTNQVGWTTGMSATPALGGFPGARVTYEVKF